MASPHDTTALFSNSPAPAKLTLDCPACGHGQSEPGLALSSICRSCGEYFKIRNGRALPSRPAPVNPFGNRRPAPATVPTPDPAATEPNRPAVDSPMPTRVAKEDRDIDCLHCGQSHPVPGSSTTSQCPHCHTSGSLQDFDINQDWTKRIQTRGDVIVRPDGHVRGAVIQCYNLTVQGAIDGGAECSGEFLLNRSATLTGHLHCKTLHVGPHGKLSLAYPAIAEDVMIEGSVQGHLKCSGRVVLGEHATFTGDIMAAAIVIHPGAQHTGQIQMAEPSLATTVSAALSEED